MRKSRSQTVPALQKAHRARVIGITPSSDVWTNKLRCECGSKFKRYKWREDKNKRRHFGYSCYSRFNNGRASVREQLGLDTEGYCDMPSVNEHKLDVMAAVLMDNLMKDKGEVIEEAIKILNETLKEKSAESKKDVWGIQQRIEKAENKLDNLLTMRTEQEISKEEYRRARAKIEEEIKELNAELNEEQDETANNNLGFDMNYIRELLGKISFMEDGRVEKDLLFELVDTITVCKNNVFKWGLWLSKKPNHIILTTTGRGKSLMASLPKSPENDPNNPKNGTKANILYGGCMQGRQTLKIPETNFGKIT